jgi:hypothetical protein
MAARRRTRKMSWREKLEHDEGLPKIVSTPPKMQKAHGKGRMLIARPLDVDALIRKVRKGRLVTVNQLRAHLAREQEADSTCPMTTGIFIRIVAEVAEEDRAAGKRRVAPYWRVVREHGALNPKYPGGVAAQARRLREEGHRIQAGRGKSPPRVLDFERTLARNIG